MKVAASFQHIIQKLQLCGHHPFKLNHTVFGKRKKKSPTLCVTLRQKQKRHFCHLVVTFLEHLFFLWVQPLQVLLEDMGDSRSTADLVDKPTGGSQRTGIGLRAWHPFASEPRKATVNQPSRSLLAGLQTDSFDRHLPPWLIVSLWHRKMSAFHGTKGHS